MTATHVRWDPAVAIAWQERWHREFASRWRTSGSSGGLFPVRTVAPKLEPLRPCRDVILELERELSGLVKYDLR